MSILVANTKTMFPRLRIIFIFTFIVFTFAGFSQQKWSNTLLWRISGNGVQKPSYLYGTMHLQDRRLFHFTDSLYTALEKVEGFALEIDFNELMDSLFTESFRNAEEELLEDDDEKVKIDKKKIDKSVDSILKNLNLKLDKLTKKDLKKIREYRTNRLLQQGEMPTIVDGYLYGLALRHNKWIGGIEDVADQLSLKDELGGDLTPEDVLLPEKLMRSSLEEMINIYLKKDLQALADYVDDKYSKDDLDDLLTHRNIKMARRMDSLTKLRTMFFAVGAAHLPGDSGVITLLRNKGFTVDPVFSPQSNSPEDYASKLNVIPWKKVDDNELYSVEMPGKPSDYGIFGEAAKMKVFFDLTKMTYYMVGYTIAGDYNKDALDKAFVSMAERMGGNIGKIKTKNISIGDALGKEGSFDVSKGSFTVRLYQKKNVLYLLMAGSNKRTNLNSKDVEKFFSSFHIKEALASDKKWTDFSIPGKGFSLKMPGVPKAAKAIDKSADGSEWNFITYDMADLDKGIYYLIQVRDIKPGYYLEGDTTYFSVYKGDLLGKFDKLISEETVTYQGWPAFKLKVAQNENVIYEIFNVVRGNRVYCVVGGGAAGADFSDIDKVFRSLTLEDYTPSVWSIQSSEGFLTSAPGIIKKVEKDSLDEDSDPEGQHFTSYDENEVISYEIFKEPLSSYYWVKNDSMFFETKIDAYKTYVDSIIQKRTVFNGGLKGVDIIVEKPDNNNLKKVRMFVNGDTLYTLVALVPKQHVNNSNFEKFFNDFRITKEIQPTIYSNKSKLLFEALKTQDSVEFEKAFSVLGTVEFSREDLLVLHDALMQKYITTGNVYTTVHYKISAALENLADESTVDFISKNYNQLNGDNEEVKYTVLKVLANIKTSEAFQVLKKLMLTYPPQKGQDYGLAYALKDSLELTRTLYPEILVLTKDSLFNETFVDVTCALLDSGLLSINDVLPYKANFLKQARESLKQMKQDDEYWWSYWEWIRFVGKFNDKESNDFLKLFLDVKDIDVRYSAVVALLKNNQAVSTAQIEKLAAENNYSKNLYAELKKLNKLTLFPAKYASQIKVAESEIYQNVSDEESPTSVIYIGERTAEFMGTKQKFLLFKITFAGEDYESSYLGVTGPYTIGSKEIVTDSNACGAYWEEEYDKLKIEEHFKKILAHTEEWLKKDRPADDK